MIIVRILIIVGSMLTVAIGAAAWGLIMATRITWRCGMCGKTNETGIIKFFLCMCDHMGDY